VRRRPGHRGRRQRARRPDLRELEVDWSGIPIILRLRAELAIARRRIAELEAASDRDR